MILLIFNAFFCSFIFTKVMTEIEPFYRIHDLHPTATGYFPSTPQCNVIN